VSWCSGRVCHVGGNGSDNVNDRVPADLLVSLHVGHVWSILESVDCAVGTWRRRQPNYIRWFPRSLLLVAIQHTWGLESVCCYIVICAAASHWCHLFIGFLQSAESAMWITFVGCLMELFFFCESCIVISMEIMMWSITQSYHLSAKPQEVGELEMGQWSIRIDEKSENCIDPWKSH